MILFAHRWGLKHFKLCFNRLLLDGAKLDSDYDRYPYLFTLANDLVDLKLSNPNLSDSERLNSALTGLQEVKRKNRLY